MLQYRVLDGVFFLGFAPVFGPPCVSGVEGGRNNPAADGTGSGPIVLGGWTIGDWQDGDIATLTPNGHDAKGRGSFLLRGVGAGVAGDIVAPPFVRAAVRASGETALEVVPRAPFMDARRG